MKPCHLLGKWRLRLSAHVQPADIFNNFDIAGSLSAAMLWRLTANRKETILEFAKVT